MPTHLQAHFYFLQRTIPPQKNKKELASQRTQHDRKKQRTANSTYKKLAVQCFV